MVRALVLRLMAMAAGERDDDVLARDVVEIFCQCALHPIPPEAVEMPAEQLADAYAQAASEPWRAAAAEDARLRRELADTVGADAAPGSTMSQMLLSNQSDATATPVANGVEPNGAQRRTGKRNERDFADAAEHGVRGRRRTRPASGDADGDSDADDDGDSSGSDVIVQWTQCERCQRWVQLPPDVDASSLPPQWFCELNTWADDDAERQCAAK